MAGCKRSASNSLEVLAAVLAESDDISFEEDDTDCSPPGRHCIEQFLPSTYYRPTRNLAERVNRCGSRRLGVPCPSWPFFSYEKACEMSRLGIQHSIGLRDEGRPTNIRIAMRRMQAEGYEKRDTVPV